LLDKKTPDALSLFCFIADEYFAFLLVHTTTVCSFSNHNRFRRGGLISSKTPTTETLEDLQFMW
jgi:hypothetical protein